MTEMGKRRFVAVVPGFSPAGGVIKILDYARHAVELGYAVTIVAERDKTRPVDAFDLGDHPQLADHTDVEVFRGDLARMRVSPSTIVMFTWPSQYTQICDRLPRDFAPERLIQLVQNVRLGNPEFLDGAAVRVLARPATRIAVADPVYHAIARYVPADFITRVIVESHNWQFFHRDRRGGLPTRIRVAYTTWKTDTGDRVAAALDSDDRFEFRAIRGPSDWHELRALYHWCDVFLCFPNREEGFYLAGLEAFAAGAIALTPDVGGNRAYADFGANCVHVDFDSVHSYVDALRKLSKTDTDAILRMRSRAYARLGAHTLDRERAEFARLLGDIGEPSGSRRAHADYARDVAQGTTLSDIAKTDAYRSELWQLAESARPEVATP